MKVRCRSCGVESERYAARVGDKCVCGGRFGSPMDHSGVNEDAWIKSSWRTILEMSKKAGCAQPGDEKELEDLLD